MSYLLEAHDVPSVKNRGDLKKCFDITAHHDIRLKSGYKSLVASPKNIDISVSKNRKKTTAKSGELECDNEKTDTDLLILQYLPQDVVSEMDEETLHLIRDAGKSMRNTSEPSVELVDENVNENNVLNDDDYDAALVALIAGSHENSEWETCTLNKCKQCFTDAQTIQKAF